MDQRIARRVAGDRAADRHASRIRLHACERIADVARETRFHVTARCRLIAIPDGLRHEGAEENCSLGSVVASPTATVPLKGSVLTTVASAKLSLVEGAAAAPPGRTNARRTEPAIAAVATANRVFRALN